MGEHYICDGGCKGVSEQPGVCQDENCPKNGQPLSECDCADMNHHGAFEEPPKDEKPENVPEQI